MDIRVEGLDSVLADLDFTAKEINDATDDIAKEVSTVVLEEAIKNVDGPNAPISAGGLPYPVRVITGNLKRSLKAERVRHAVHRIFADSTIANYAIFVHEGTSKMKARPFLDDAVDTVLINGKHIEIGGRIIDSVLSKR